MSRQAHVALMAGDWFERSQRDDFAAWEGLTEWLESDTGHADAFARLAALEDALVSDYAAWPAPSAATVEEPAPNRRTGWWQAAAVIALTVGGLGAWLAQGPDLQVYAAQGELRSVALAGGDRAVLAPGARLALDEDAPRFAQVLAGEVYFVVRHDARRPFEVLLPGGERVIDLGTRFVVSGDEGTARVAVSEGSVRFSGPGLAQELQAGEALIAQGGRLSLHRVDSANVAAWADTAISFDDARLSDVAPLLSQAIGVPLRVRPDVASRRVTATIFVDARLDAEPRRLAALLGLVATRDGDGWILSED